MLTFMSLFALAFLVIAGIAHVFGDFRLVIVDTYKGLLIVVWRGLPGVLSGGWNCFFCGLRVGGLCLDVALLARLFGKCGKSGFG